MTKEKEPYLRLFFLDPGSKGRDDIIDLDCFGCTRNDEYVYKSNNTAAIQGKATVTSL